MDRPKVLKIWDDECVALRERMPRVCFNCYWDRQGWCEKHEAEPPTDFAETPNACHDWKDEVPF
jgi:hypothetical protein